MKRKIISLLLTMAMLVVSVTGCGSAKENADENQKDQTSNVSSDTTSEETGDFKNSLEGVSLAFGTSGTYAPFSYFNEDGTTLQGFDLE